MLKKCAIISAVLGILLVSANTASAAIISAYHPADTDQNFQISFTEGSAYYRSNVPILDKLILAQLEIQFQRAAASNIELYYYLDVTNKYKTTTEKPAPVTTPNTHPADTTTGLGPNPTLGADYIITFPELQAFLNHPATTQAQKTEVINLFIKLLTTGHDYYYWNANQNSWDTTAVAPAIAERRVEPVSIINSPITVSSPNGGEALVRDTRQTITWRNACLGDSCKAVDITLVSANPSFVPNYTLIRNYTPDSSIAPAYTWLVGSTMDGRFLVTNAMYKVKVCRTGTTTCDESDAYFRISDTNSTIPVVTMVYPQNGQTLTCCSGYMFKVKPVTGATGYRYRLYQKDDSGREQLIFDNSSSDPALNYGYRYLSPDGEWAFFDDNPVVKKIKGGRDLRVEISAFANGIYGPSQAIIVRISVPSSTNTNEPSISQLSNSFTVVPTQCPNRTDRSYQVLRGNFKFKILAGGGGLSEPRPADITVVATSPNGYNQTVVPSLGISPSAISIYAGSEYIVSVDVALKAPANYPPDYYTFSLSSFTLRDLNGKTYQRQNLSKTPPTILATNNCEADIVVPTPTPTPVVDLTPTFSFDQDGVIHRLFVKLGASGGKINSIKQVSPAGTCYGLTTPVAVSSKAAYASIPNCSLGGASYGANSSCGVYLQKTTNQTSSCVIAVEYQGGLTSRVTQFESYLPAGAVVNTGERIRQLTTNSASIGTSDQTAQVVSVLQALIKLLSGR